MSQHASNHQQEFEAQFATTRWSLVLATRVGGQDARRALLALCLRYWYPVYVYLRRCGHPPEIAQDIARAFFQDVLHAGRDRLPADAAQGRFREFLLAALHQFLARDWRRDDVTPDANGGPAPDLSTLEARLHDDPTVLGPEQAFRRSYALDVLASAQQRLAREAQQAGREPMFDALHPFLARDPVPGDYEAMAERLGTRPLALVVALRRLRRRMRELTEEELAQTVSSAADLDSERTTLLAALQP